MALRLTGTSLPQLDHARRGDVDVRTPGPAFGRALADRARSLLAAGDLDGYAGLFTAVATHEDPVAQVHARMLLLEMALRAAAAAGSAGLATRLFVAIAEAALDALEQEPREPALLNYAGVALYELWSLDAAAAMFAAAQRLDPSLPQLEGNFAELRQRRRDAGRRRVGVLHATVPALAARAKRVAACARPAEGLTLSLCMIVRDEEELLPRCLAAAAPVVDEIVIVDTGSEDRTIEIARSFGARVIERAWTGDFAEARNVGLDAATGDWLLVLDADEVLVSEDAERLRELLGHVWREAFVLVETNYMGEEDDGVAMNTNALRVFRNRPAYRYEGRMHEQIAHRLPNYVRGRTAPTSVRIEHYGYLSVVVDAKDKSRRNIELLRAQRAESGPSAFNHFNLGTELLAAGDAAAAAAEFESGLATLSPEQVRAADWVASPMRRLVIALWSCDRAEDALARAEEGLALFPAFTDLEFLRGSIAVDLGDHDAAAAAWKRCIEMGDAPAQYGAVVGSGTYLPRIALAELEISRGELDAARDLLDWCMAQHPESIGVVAPYASLLLRRGLAPAAVSEQVDRQVGLTPRVRFVLAGELVRWGAAEAAAEHYREVLRARPHTSQARVALAETLLHQRRYVEAATEAAMLDDDEDPCAKLARRIELWGRIAAGDLDGARAAHARAAKAGVSDVELQMFQGWMALVAGEPAPAGLPVAGTLVLGAILETLLQTHDFDAFERLLPLLEQSALSRRERRELLGSMYLRRGFLVSAAQEWMAVCQEQADARALLGLARVALAHNQPEEAAVFARETLALEPSNAAATEILDRCQATAATPS